jgi:hypothetical protein
MLYHLEFADWVPGPVPRVFAFFADPENLPGLMIPSTGTSTRRWRWDDDSLVHRIGRAAGVNLP